VPETQILLSGLAIGESPRCTRIVCGSPTGVRKKSLLLINSAVWLSPASSSRTLA
jgi:hypothetical protein